MNVVQIFGQDSCRALLHSALAVKDDIENEYAAGSTALCSALYQSLPSDISLNDKDDAMGARDWLYRAWPEFSGSSGYPVPAPEEDREKVAALLEYRLTEVDWDIPKEAAEAFFDAVDIYGLYDGNFYDTDTEYGRSRIRLLDYIIATLQENLG